MAGTTGFPLQGLVSVVISEQAASGWELQDGEFWCHANPPERTERTQGWKLHVSATPLSAAEVLYRAATVLVRHDCHFKFTRSMTSLRDITGIRAVRAQCGKFITAYPRDNDHFTELAKLLDRATAGLPGPAILSDRPYRRGSLVHYRYGAFAGHRVLTADGGFETRIVAPDGKPVPDERNPWFSPPEWAEFPLPGPPPRPVLSADGAKPVLLRDRYVVSEAIQHSARGGVYRALDRRSGSQVVIKQARAHVGATHEGRDARDGLRAEAAALTALGPVTPEVIEIFEQDEHVFLVETLIPGVSLAEWVRRQWTEETPDGGITPRRAIDLALGLAKLLEVVHSKGLVFRDFSPNNVMVMDDGQMRLIDPEFAVEAGQWVYCSYTPGFAAPEYAEGDSYYAPAPGLTADLYSLGAVLFFVATGVSPALTADVPKARPTIDRLRRILEVRRRGEDGAVARLLSPAIFGLCAEDAAERWPLTRLKDELAAAFEEPDEGEESRMGFLTPAGTTYKHLVDDGLKHILTTKAESTASRLWRSSAFGEQTDPCSVQHGAAGVLALLTRASTLLGGEDLRSGVEQVASWVDAHLSSVPRVLPGLYFGRSGTAWALHDAATHLGDPALAGRAVQLGLSVPVNWPNPDVCHGAAGAGLAQLHLWQTTGRPEFLDRAVSCADGLLEAAEHLPDGVFWPVPEDLDSALAGIRHFGFAHGVAGIGTFLLAAARVTGTERYAEVARAAGDTLVLSAERGPWGARWRADRADRAASGMLYHWCSGASGIGTFLVRLWQATGDKHILELAEEAATAVRRARWYSPTAACHGLAGNGQFLLDLADAVGGPYRAWAEEVAVVLETRCAVRDGLLVPPDESGTEVTVDYQTGLSGVVDFLLRLDHGGPRPWMVDPATGGRS